MSTVDAAHPPFQHAPKHLEESEEHKILHGLVMDALNYPEKCADIIGIFFDQIEGLIDSCYRTQDRNLAKTLKIAVKCLNTIHDAFAEGDDKQKTLISNYEELIDDISKTALECITTIPKEQQAPIPPKEKPAAQEAPAQPPIDPLIAEAVEKKDDEALLSYCAKGAPLHLLSQDDKDRLAEKAVSSFNDEALATLIRGGCRIFSPEGKSPILLDCVSGNFFKSVNALIERHANLHSTDSHGNTALHRAFFLGNAEMARLLMQHIDPKTPNAAGQTPLKALLNIHPDNIEYVQIQEPHVPFFLEQLFKRGPEEVPGAMARETYATGILLKISGGRLPHFPVNIVEMAFLADDPDLYGALFSQIDTETFLSACSHLAERYPKESVAQFMATPYAINDFHYQMGGQSAPLPPLGDRDQPLETFYSLFESLNFYNPDAPHYVDAVSWWRECTSTNEMLPREVAIEQLRQKLHEGFGRIIRRERNYSAIPTFEPEKWFDRTELRLKHIILALREKNNPATTLGTLKELRESFSHCATALTTASISLYERLCFNIDPRQPDLAFLRPLANYRRQCFDEAVNQVYGGEIHHGHKDLVELGPELGLPGHEEAAQYIDPVPPRPEECKPLEVKQDFVKRYTPQSIIDWFFQAWKANIDNIRDPYIDLHRHFMNPTWNKERYFPIFERLYELEREGRPVDEFLKKSDIVKASKDQSPREAVENDRFNDYLEHFVYDEKGQPRPRAAIHLFTCMGVIHPVTVHGGIMGTY